MSCVSVMPCVVMMSCVAVMPRVAVILRVAVIPRVAVMPCVAVMLAPGVFHILKGLGREHSSQPYEIKHSRHFRSYERSRTLGTLSAKASYYGRK